MESKEKPAASLEKWRQIIPNALTIARIILVPVFIALMIMQHMRGSVSLLIVSLVVFCVASYTDHLDGKLARRWQVVSDFGKLVDPIADKALMISAFVLLSLFQNLWWWFTAVVILREVAVTLLRMYLLRSGVVLPASKGGKIKTSLQILMVFLWMLAGICYPFNTQVGVVIMYLAIAVLIAAFVATVLSGLVYFLDAHDNQKEQAKAAGSGDKGEDNTSLAKAGTDTAELGEDEEEAALQAGKELSSSSPDLGSETASETDTNGDALEAVKTWEPRAKRAARRKDPKAQETKQDRAATTTTDEPEVSDPKDKGEVDSVSPADTLDAASSKDKVGEHQSEGDQVAKFPSRRTRRSRQAQQADGEAAPHEGQQESSEANQESPSIGRIPDLSAASASPTPASEPEPAEECLGSEESGSADEETHEGTPRFAMTRSQLRRQKKK